MSDLRNSLQQWVRDQIGKGIPAAQVRAEITAAAAEIEAERGEQSTRDRLDAALREVSNGD